MCTCYFYFFRFMFFGWIYFNGSLNFIVDALLWRCWRWIASYAMTTNTFPGLLVKWKNLEFLTIVYCSYILEILDLIHIHLPKFIGLCIKDTEIDDVLASAIVSLFPNINYLIINRAKFQKEYLLLILQGCKELECLDVRNCTGFSEDDEEILKLSSGIKNFRCDGSKAQKDCIDILEISFNDLYTIIMDSALIESDLYILYHSWNWWRQVLFEIRTLWQEVEDSCLPFLHQVISISVFLYVYYDTILWGLRDCSISAIENNYGLNLTSSFSEVCYLVKCDSSIPLAKLFSDCWGVWF